MEKDLTLLHLHLQESKILCKIYFWKNQNKLQLYNSIEKNADATIRNAWGDSTQSAKLSMFTVSRSEQE